MGKRVILFILGMLLLIGAAGCSTGEKKVSEPKKVLKVGTSPDFSPFEFIDSKNQMTGFDIELIQALGKQMNAEIKLQNLSFDGLIPALQACNLDLVISGVTIIPERGKAVLFTEPYYQSRLVAAVGIENQEIKGWDDLKGKRIAVQIGSTGAINAEKVEGATVRSFNLSPDTFLELKIGGVDAVVNDLPVVQYFIKNQGAKYFKIVGVPRDAESYGIAVQSQNTELAKQLNTALTELKKNGEYDKLYEKWFVKKPPKETNK